NKELTSIWTKSNFPHCLLSLGHPIFLFDYFSCWSPAMPDRSGSIEKLAQGVALSDRPPHLRAQQPSAIVGMDRGADHRHRRLLRAGGERPGSRRAAEQCDEAAASHGSPSLGPGPQITTCAGGPNRCLRPHAPQPGPSL